MMGYESVDNHVQTMRTSDTAASDLIFPGIILTHKSASIQNTPPLSCHSVMPEFLSGKKGQAEWSLKLTHTCIKIDSNIEDSKALMLAVKSTYGKSFKYAFSLTSKYEAYHYES